MPPSAALEHALIFSFLLACVRVQYESHPFSISSAPGAFGDPSIFTLHILDMGRPARHGNKDGCMDGPTFTHMLAQTLTATGAAPIGLAGGPTASPSSIVAAKPNPDAALRLEGPYGRLGVDLSQYELVLLVAGGIGVTPLMAVFTDLYRSLAGLSKASPPSTYGRLKGAHLIWSAITSAPFEHWFPRELHEIQTNMSPGTLGTRATPPRAQSLRSCADLSPLPCPPCLPASLAQVSPASSSLIFTGRSARTCRRPAATSPVVLCNRPTRSPAGRPFRWWS
jgi:hypothetical protein